MSAHYYLGWDVGAWYCDINAKSRGAILILDESGTEVGRPYRGSLRRLIDGAGSTEEWLDALFAACNLHPAADARVTMAIDTPLGFPVGFIDLLSRAQAFDTVGERRANPYLFRATERHLFALGWSPMSAIESMIGSQATKGMHLLARFAPDRTSCGVWRGGDRFTAIETYPTPCRTSATISEKLRGRSDLPHDALRDARLCALVAYLFGTDREVLTSPPPEIPEREGWIWIPRDVTAPRRK